MPLTPEATYAPMPDASSPPTCEGPDRPPISVAPMMAWTDHHFRQMMRLLTRRTLLYTEMYPVDVILEASEHSPERLQRLLGFDAAQRPLAVQIGGRDPMRMGEAARLCAMYGYDEVNINVGCPSETVSMLQGYGACLMKDEALVQQLAAAVRSAVPPDVAVTVKHRLGVDDHDSWEALVSFVRTVSAPPASIRHFVVHARKAILGLTTSDNRSVPPLRRDWVGSLAAEFPGLSFELNGALMALHEAEVALDQSREREPNAPLRACMIGRAAFHDPWQFGDCDRRFFGASNLGTSRREVIERYAAYAEATWAEHSARLTAEATREMDASGEKALPHAVRHRLQAPLRELRQRLYQPLLHLCVGVPGSAEYQKRLLRAEEKHTGVAKAAASALRALPDEVADARHVP